MSVADDAIPHNAVADAMGYGVEGVTFRLLEQSIIKILRIRTNSFALESFIRPHPNEFQLQFPSHTKQLVRNRTNSCVYVPNPSYPNDSLSQKSFVCEGFLCCPTSISGLQIELTINENSPLQSQRAQWAEEFLMRVPVDRRSDPNIGRF